MHMRNWVASFMTVLVLLGAVSLHADEAQYLAWRQQQDWDSLFQAYLKEDTYALIGMGNCHVYSEPGCKQDILSGTNLWSKAAAKGEYWLFNRLVMTLAEGTDVRGVDPGQLPMWKPLCSVAVLIRDRFQEQMIESKGKAYLGLCFMAGREGISKDPTYGFALLDWAATQDRLPDAADILADIYNNGHYGVGIDRIKSAYYKNLAASHRQYLEAVYRARIQAANPGQTQPAIPGQTQPANPEYGIDAWDPNNPMPGKGK
ncbi:MAG: hypothetical protein HQL65_07765 [Magnetococcales bacterium]|nr:hypothetical protein [Magnetococcales bacterium]